MPRRFPLSAKIVLWFLLNLLLLAVLFIALLRAQFHPGPDWLLSRSANDRIDALSDIIVSELSQEPPAQWDATLNRFDSGYQNKVRFLAFDGRGQRLAGKAVELPDDVRHRLMEPRGPAPHGPPPFAEGADLPRAEPLMLVIVSDSLGAGGLFFDVGPWIAFALAVLLLSVLLWFPLVRGINRSIAQMTAATRQIAAGRFDARVDERRRDELGALGQAINQMAARLAGLVAGQKRFLGDVAHELCSPLARLRVSLGILDQRADGVQKPYVASAEDEAAHIAELVNELLSFSRASLAASAAPLRAVNLLQVVEKIAGREAAGQALVRIEVPPELTAMADPELLARALANLLRNAVRYAGQAGAIFISAQRQGDEVRVAVSDCGPGVPAGELERIFDPFYRVDASRDRATGGVGLGLAIVKTCVEACGGTVACHNREPSGLEAVIRLRANADK